MTRRCLTYCEKMIVCTQGLDFLYKALTSLWLHPLGCLWCQTGESSMMPTAEVQFISHQWVQIRAGLFEYVLGLKAF